MLRSRAGFDTLRRRISSTACSFFQAKNEPIFDYLPGDEQHVALQAKLKEYDSKTTDIPIVIGDEELTSNDVRYQVKPHAHQEQLAKYYWADKNLLQKAIDVGQKAHREWERRPQEERTEIFKKAGDLVANKYRMDLMATTMLGQGKTIIQGEIDSTCELADFYRFGAQYAQDLQNVQPIGKVGDSTNKLTYRSCEGFWASIAPFNFTAISGNLAGIPALMGNVVLWKPSDTAMLSSYVCFKLLREAGVPAGVISFVPADGPVFGNAICNSPLLAGINFTGSTRTFQHLWGEVAKNLHKYKSYPRLIGECGGKNFHFVHNSADVDSVVSGTIRSAFEYSGQKCSACSRMYVPESIWPKVKEGLLREHAKIKLGSPLENDTFLSAVIDDKSFARIKNYIDHAKDASNMDVLAGGKCDDSNGYYVEPTIIETKDPQDKIMTEEIFGPVLAIYVYRDADYKNVLHLIDESSPYALTGAVFSQDKNVVAEASDILRFACGNYYINDKSTGSVVAQQPFGGARMSGTNDKAGSPHYVLRFVSPQAVKETHAPLGRWDYPYMKA